MKKNMVKQSNDIIACDMKLNHLNEVVEIENSSFSTPWLKDAFISELERNKYAKYRVITIKNKVVAYGGMWIAYDRAHITNIAVHPQYRHKGLGNIILEDIIEYAKASNINSITLEVRKSNIPAINLYTKYGFKEVAVKKGYYVDSGEDGIVMQRHE